MGKAVSPSLFYRAAVNGLLQLVMLLLSILLVMVISVDTFRGVEFYDQPSYLQLQFWICLLFLFDFFIEWALSEHKVRFFFTHFIFLLVAIPYHNIFSWLGWTASPEAIYIVRFAPLIRGLYAMVIIISWFTYSRIVGMFVSYLVMLLVSVYFGSLIFYMVEHGSNPLVGTYPDALWWAFMDATTVGSNIIAVTPVGKVLSVIVAAIGMMMFPIFTIYITNLIERKTKKEQAETA